MNKYFVMWRRSTSAGDRQVEAFTRVELLAVLAALLVLAPLLSANHQASRSAICLNNLRQLAAAMALYAADSSDYLPPNPDDGSPVAGHYWCAGSMSNPTQATNLLFVTKPLYNVLTRCVEGNARTFKCPEDQRLVFNAPTVRSYSLNHAVGTICPGFDSGGGHAGVPNLSVNGPWLDGNHSHRRNMPYATYGKITDFRKPNRVFTFIDEDPYSINDGTFNMSMAMAKWVDFPSTGHDRGGTLAFADGHVEIHHWLVDSTRVKNGNVNQVSVSGDPRDWQWLADRTTQKYLAK